MGNLNGPYYPHALIQGFAYAHITLFAYAHITIFDIPSVMHLRANYLAFNMYLVSNTDSIRVYTDCAIIWYLNSENTCSH